jgi:hypothetical protein
MDSYNKIMEANIADVEDLSRLCRLIRLLEKWDTNLSQKMAKSIELTKLKPSKNMKTKEIQNE